MRRCDIPPGTCRHSWTTPCCKDCGDTACGSRCQNTPERCGCWSDKPPKQERERKVDPLQVVRLYGSGLTQAEIAGRLECNRKTVGKILHERGMTRHA